MTHRIVGGLLVGGVVSNGGRGRVLVGRGGVAQEGYVVCLGAFQAVPHRAGLSLLLLATNCLPRGNSALLRHTFDSALSFSSTFRNVSSSLSRSLGLCSFLEWTAAAGQTLPNSAGRRAVTLGRSRRSRHPGLEGADRQREQRVPEIKLDPET